MIIVVFVGLAFVGQGRVIATRFLSDSAHCNSLQWKLNIVDTASQLEMYYDCKMNSRAMSQFSEWVLRVWEWDLREDLPLDLDVSSLTLNWWDRWSFAFCSSLWWLYQLILTTSRDKFLELKLKVGGDLSSDFGGGGVELERGDEEECFFKWVQFMLVLVIIMVDLVIFMVERWFGGEFHGGEAWFPIESKLEK